MNPNATPFHMPHTKAYATTKTYATVIGEQLIETHRLAIHVPFAPIEMLTDGQKVQQQVDEISKKITYQELLALSTSISAAEFVLA